MRYSTRPASYRSPELLGKSFVDRQHEIVLRIGDDQWSREGLVTDLKCGNFAAAARLTKTLERDRVNSVQDAVRRISLHDLLEREGVGETTAYVFMCAIDAIGKNPLTWCGQGHSKAQPLRTLPTEKRRALSNKAARPKTNGKAKRTR
jgi:hypothetical protein